MSNTEISDRADRVPMLTADQRAALREIARRHEVERPTAAQLVASGKYDGPLPLEVFQNYMLAMQELKQAREEQKLSLSDVADRTGMDRGAISKLENGQTNPTFQTVGRYAAGIGKRIRIVLEDLSPQDSGVSGAPTLAR